MKKRNNDRLSARINEVKKYWLVFDEAVLVIIPVVANIVARQ